MFGNQVNWCVPELSLRVVLSLLVSFGIMLPLGDANATDMARTWPGFRGHEMSGVAASAKLPVHWTRTEGVAWAVDVPGQGWSSPIIWEKTIFVTSAIGTKDFKKPSTGIFGNDYAAELQKQGMSMPEIMKRLRERDIESTEEAAEIRYMVYALDAKTGKVRWEREAFRGAPSGGRHRKNTYASETPFTDGQRLYVSFGQNVGMFCYSLDGKLLWKKQWPPKKI